MGRDYDKEIIQALKQRPRDGLALQNDLHISASRMYSILKGMEADGSISWDGKAMKWMATEIQDGE